MLIELIEDQALADASIGQIRLSSQHLRSLTDEPFPKCNCTL